MAATKTKPASRSTSAGSGQSASRQTTTSGPQIKVTIGQMSARPKTVQVKKGSTVRAVLKQAEVEIGKRSVIIRGVKVNRDYVLQGNETLVVTDNIDGG